MSHITAFVSQEALSIFGSRLLLGMPFIRQESVFFLFQINFAEVSDVFLAPPPPPHPLPRTHARAHTHTLHSPPFCVVYDVTKIS